MTEYETVVGLEIHAHLKTESKMFCRCAVPSGKDYDVSKRDEPNVRVCPICTGQPGTLPVPNKKAIEDAILLGLALGSKIAPKFNFERKNYFYPDLPKAYQITSSTNPPVLGGKLHIDFPVPGYKFKPEDDYKTFDKYIELDHVHLEEDAGKLTHDKSGDFSLVDLNRAGTPLLEIITKPGLSDGIEAMVFMKRLRAILRYLAISDADMEKGQMRCDANISVREKGAKELGTKVEIKNLNSFKMVSLAVQYESGRQVEILEEGGKIEQETRGWDDSKGKTVPQRSKEFAHDYRYFPEPDIPPIETGKDKAFDPAVINGRLPELPEDKKTRFITEYGLPSDYGAHEAGVLTDNIDIANFYEKVIENLPQAAGSSEKKKELGKLVANLLITEVLGKVGDIAEIKAGPKEFSEMIDLIDNGSISGKIAKDIIPEVLKGKSPKQIIEHKNLTQISDENELNKIVVQVLAQNKDHVEKYKAGKEQLFGFFVGQVMQATKGQANPQIVNEILKDKLK